MPTETKELNTETVTFNITPSLNAKLKRAAEAQMLPVATFIRRVLAKAIKDE